MSSLEGLSQGLCVIAGLDDWNIRCIRDFSDREKLPWIVARNEEELKTCLGVLIEDQDLRQEHEEYSRQFMEDCWTEQHALKKLLDVYKVL